MTTEPDPERDDGTLPRFWTGRRIALAVTVPVVVVFLIAVATSSAFVKRTTDTIGSSTAASGAPT